MKIIGQKGKLKRRKGLCAVKQDFVIDLKIDFINNHFYLVAFFLFKFMLLYFIIIITKWQCTAANAQGILGEK